MATEMKCACADCSCLVSADKAVMNDGKSFCCEACANAHADHKGYGHDGCQCHG